MRNIIVLLWNICNIEHLDTCDTLNKSLSKKVKVRGVKLIWFYKHCDNIHCTVFRSISSTHKAMLPCWFGSMYQVSCWFSRIYFFSQSNPLAYSQYWNQNIVFQTNFFTTSSCRISLAILRFLRIHFHCFMMTNISISLLSQFYCRFR